ncbi:NAD(P)/FAD-dependent oxidoreductase [Aeromicrobium sp. UC242_57]|uniref:NAD(P)/FAD-dependent oxidoreductase n=1 Tax=Aeromicrobium sp. UC242_57 TaxID=3374624 RepID=UPI00379E619E
MTDDAGRVHSFDAAVIATGVRARTLDTLSNGRPHVLRTMTDAVRLRERLQPGTRLVVVGEASSALRPQLTAVALGVDVIVIEPTLHPLSNRLGMKTSDRLMELHVTHGVSLRLGVSVVSSSTDADGTWTLTLTDQSTVHADEVLVSVGSVPETDWLSGSGLQIDNGVVCDASCQAAPHVWAVGDVARWWDGRQQAFMRLEHRTNAIEQADAVAKGILGIHRDAYEPVPFFWTDHFDARIQLAGTFSEDSSETLIDIDSAKGSTITLFHRDDQLTAVLGWSAPKDFQKYRRQLILEHAERSV